MSIKTIIVDGVDTAFDILDSLSTTATYKSSGSYQYNPSSKDNVETGGANYIFDAILTIYKRAQTNRKTTVKQEYQLLIQGSAITSEGIAPKVGDTVSISQDGYYVRGLSKDPADGLWVLDLRYDKYLSSLLLSPVPVYAIDTFAISDSAMETLTTGLWFNFVDRTGATFMDRTGFTFVDR